MMHLCIHMPTTSFLCTPVASKFRLKASQSVAERCCGQKSMDKKVFTPDVQFSTALDALFGAFVTRENAGKTGCDMSQPSPPR